MINNSHPFIILILLSLISLTGCNEAEDIPKIVEEESDTITQDNNLVDESIDGQNNQDNIVISETVKNETKSIKEAAVEAVKIIEEEAQIEIDAIEPISETISPENTE